MKTLIVLTILAMAATIATADMQIDPSSQVQQTQQQPFLQPQQPFVHQPQQQFPQPQQPFPQQPQQQFPQSQQPCLQQSQQPFPQPLQSFPQQPLQPFPRPVLPFPEQLQQPFPRPPQQLFPQPPQSFPQQPLQPFPHPLLPFPKQPQQTFPRPSQQPFPEQPQQPFPGQQPSIESSIQQQLNPCKEFLLQQCSPVTLVSYLRSKILQQSNCQVMRQQCCQQLAQIPEQFKCTAIHSIVNAIIMQQEQRQGIHILQQQPQQQQVGQCVLVQGQGIIQPQQLAQLQVIRSLVLQTLPTMCNVNVPPSCSTIKAPFSSIVTGVGGQ